MTPLEKSVASFMGYNIFVVELLDRPYFLKKSDFLFLDWLV